MQIEKFKPTKLQALIFAQTGINFELSTVVRALKTPHAQRTAPWRALLEHTERLYNYGKEDHTREGQIAEAIVGFLDSVKWAEVPAGRNRITRGATVYSFWLGVATNGETLHITEFQVRTLYCPVDFEAVKVANIELKVMKALGKGSYFRIGF